jgi:hypothetical protein
VVWPHGIGQDAQALPRKGLGEDAPEGLVIAVLLEESVAGRGAVGNGVDEAARGIARASWHPQHRTPRLWLTQVELRRGPNAIKLSRRSLRE